MNKTNTGDLLTVSIADLTPYESNARTHSEDQVLQIAASIREFGFTNPVLIDGENGIIAGHSRVLAARKLGIESVPAIRIDYMTDAQKRAYIIADNKLALSAGWDDELLALELGELRDLGFDLDLTGFDKDELANLLLDPEEIEEEGLTDEDEVGELPATPVTVPGDVFVLGKHRLMCGDSTSIDAVDKLMAGQKADICFTSPPYGQQRDYGQAKSLVEDWDGLMSGVFSILPVTHSAQVLVNLGLIHKDCEWQPYWQNWLEEMRDAGWRRFGLYVWDQGPGLPGDWSGRFAPSFELVFHFNKDARKPQKWIDKKEESIREKGGTGLRRADGTMSGVSNPEAGLQPTKIPDSVIRINRQATERLGHPAAFPVALPEYVFMSYAAESELAYEPFCGSGTTLIACEKNNMRCCGMELDPKYCDVIINRWQAFTGKQATLEATGQTFDDLKAERLPQSDKVPA